MPQIVLTVDDEQFVQFLRVAEEGLARLALAAAEELQTWARAESAPVSNKIAAGWAIEGAGDNLDLVSNVWYAHFPARGTGAHGPVSAPALVFEGDGGVVFAQQVSGIGANPFHERAVHDTEVRVNEILTRALAGLG